jgi:carbon storage regulator
MLVLSRKVDEEIVIDVAGHEIVVKVVRVGAGGVRLGVTADDDVSVHRREVWERIGEELQPVAQ